jgi:hypothetical protein
LQLHLPDPARKPVERFVEEIKPLVDCDSPGGPVCRPACPEARKRQCSADCPQAPLALTSDGEFPIETNIVPLVYALKATGVFQPVWSCEGHLDNRGALRRPPSVWFCCDYLPQVRILAEAVSQMQIAERLSARWRVALRCPGHQTPQTLFALEADMSPMPSLETLQADVSRIAGRLRPQVSALARNSLAQHGKLPGAAA